MHIGSQILENEPYEKMLKVLEKLLNKTKHNFEYIDLGGGMGINYEDKKKQLNLKKYCLNIKNF